jgi:Na+/H+ antiporter 1
MRFTTGSNPWLPSCCAPCSRGRVILCCRCLLSQTPVSPGPPWSCKDTERVVVLAIVLGLVLGKPIGMALGAALAVRLGIAVRPEEYSWVQMIGAGALAGVGFTMSLYIAHKAFPDESDFAAAKVGIFLASLIAGGLGTTLLWRAAASDLGKSNQTTSISKGR